MSGPPTPAPPPFQTGFVVDDLDAALKYWTEVVGAGPFFVFDELDLHVAPLTDRHTAIESDGLAVVIQLLPLI